jgi:hypothetical protein
MSDRGGFLRSRGYDAESCARTDKGTSLGGPDDGFVLMLTALLILPLLAFTGLAVDLGAWLARAAAQQRAADAAALAGVARLPDTGSANTVAIEVAKRNGFDNADPEITVTPSDAGPQRLKVEITDTKVDQFFTRVFTGGDVSVSRAATAEYVLPVSMGSPRNFLGTGDDPPDNLPGSLHENFWLAASGPCASRENGDYLLTISDANYYFDPAPTNQNPGPTSGNPRYNRCTGSDSEGTTIDLTDGTDGDSYEASGYFYAVEVPEGGVGQSVVVWGYDLSHCPGNSAIDSNNDGFRTTYTLRGPDSNPYIPNDNPPIGTSLNLDTSTGTSGNCSNTGSGYRNRWRQMFTISNAQEGIYFVQVQTSDVGGGVTELHGSNGFGLRASYGTTWDRNSTPCSTDPEDPSAPYTASCLGVYAIEWMGVFANLNGSFPSFYLADIGPEHSGKTMVVRLFDPGEGAQALELLDPLGNSVDFSWEVVNMTGSDTAPTGGFTGNVDQPGSGTCSSAPPACSELDVLGNDPLGTGRGWNPQPGPYRGSRSKYSDRMLELRVKLPSDIGAAYSGATWWRVRYTMGACGSCNTDRTSWSVTVTGDPVRLIK